MIYPKTTHVIIVKPNLSLATAVKGKKEPCKLIFLAEGSLAELTAKDLKVVDRVAKVHIDSGATGVSWNQIAGLRHLKVLSMDRSFGKYEGFEQMTKLTCLSLPKKFDEWSRLEKLTDLRALGKSGPTLSDLEYLSKKEGIRSLSLTNFPMDYLSEWQPRPGLKNLRIFGGRGESLRLNSCPELERLVLVHCFDLQKLHAAQVTNLFLECCKKWRIDLSELPKLEYLRLRSCTGVDFAGISAAFRLLRAVLMEATRVGGDVLASLKRHKHLNFFIPYGWNVAESEVRKVSSGMPGVVFSNGDWSYLNGERSQLDQDYVPKELDVESEKSDEQ